MIVACVNFLPPVNCEMPTLPANGSIENFQSISTVGGAQIVFRCNERFVPAGNITATCVSPDRISAMGIWNPNPANLVCNGEIIRPGFVDKVSILYM